MLEAGLHVVAQQGRQDAVDDARLEPGILDREHHLDAAEEVARHPVGAAEEDLGLAGVLEVEDPAVLQEPVDDADHPDVLGEPGDARPQAADAADDAGRSARPAWDARYSASITVGSTSAFILAMMRAGRPGLARCRRFAVDQLDHLLPQAERRDHELPPAPPLGVAGQEVEQRGGVLAELGLGGEQAQVGVEPRGRGVVVAGGEVDVAADAVRLAAHHQRALQCVFRPTKP